MLLKLKSADLRDDVYINPDNIQWAIAGGSGLEITMLDGTVLSVLVDPSVFQEAVSGVFTAIGAQKALDKEKE